MSWQTQSGHRANFCSCGIKWDLDFLVRSSRPPKAVPAIVCCTHPSRSMSDGVPRSCVSIDLANFIWSHKVQGYLPRMRNEAQAVSHNDISRQVKLFLTLVIYICSNQLQKMQIDFSFKQPRSHVWLRSEMSQAGYSHSIWEWLLGRVSFLASFPDS